MCNNLVALPLYAFGIYARGSIPKLTSFKNFDSSGFLLYFWMSSFLGITLQFTILYGPGKWPVVADNHRSAQKCYHSIFGFHGDRQGLHFCMAKLFGHKY